MKIKTITCHDVYNYGASLQAFALMRYLELEGHEVKVIDYIPDYLSHHYQFWYIPKDNRFHDICQKHWLLHLFYSIRLIPVTYKTWHRIKPFKMFKKHDLKCTRRYSSLKELQENPPNAELYIAGSDQIWNCIVSNGNDPAFYLNFGEKKTKRISYAASFAISEIPIEKRPFIIQYLKALDNISVREATGVKILNELGYQGVQVLDPVCLLSAEQWLSFAGDKPIIEENYLLVYNLFPGNGNLNVAVKRVARRHSLKVIAINDVAEYPGADKNVSNAGPREFVNLIAYSKYVICDSFHGTAFAIIFNKPIEVYYNKSNSSRISDFLTGVGMQERYNPKGEIDIQSIDWSFVSSKLKLQIDYSKDFLKDNTVLCN